MIGEYNTAIRYVPLPRQSDTIHGYVEATFNGQIFRRYIGVSAAEQLSARNEQGIRYEYEFQIAKASEQIRRDIAHHMFEIAKQNPIGPVPLSGLIAGLETATADRLLEFIK